MKLRDDIEEEEGAGDDRLLGPPEGGPKHEKTRHADRVPETLRVGKQAKPPQTPPGSSPEFLRLCGKGSPKLACSLGPSSQSR